MKTKQIVSLVLAALLSFAMLALSVGAKGSTASVIVFDDKMDVSAWSYWGRNVTSYDAGTNSFKVTANEWSMYATCMEMDSGDGTNFSTLTDIGVTPVNIRCEGGYNYLKIKMKTSGGFAPSALSAHLGTSTYFGEGQPWAVAGAKLCDLSGFENGEWQEIVVDLTKLEEHNAWLDDNQKANLQGMLLDKISLIFPEVLIGDQAVYIQYVGFFKTADEAGKYPDVNSPATGNAGIGAACAFLVFGIAAAAFSGTKRRLGK